MTDESSALHPFVAWLRNLNLKDSIWVMLLTTGLGVTIVEAFTEWALWWKILAAAVIAIFATLLFQIAQYIVRSDNSDKI